MLHRTHTCIATSRKEEGEPGHSILQHNMPDEEDPDCPEDKQRKHAGAAHMSCLTHAPVKKEEWEAWFCQFLGEQIQVLEKLLAWEARLRLRPPRHGQRSATMSTPARWSTQAAVTQPTRPKKKPDHPRRHWGRLPAGWDHHGAAQHPLHFLIVGGLYSITAIKKRNSKMGRGDLVLKHVKTLAVTATWLSMSQSTTNSAAITWLTSAATGRFVTRSQAGSWRAPLAPKWTATGPDVPRSSY